MTKPTIHSNGSSAADLFEGFAEVTGAIRRALSKMQNAAPHGRDYYPQGDRAIFEATREHEARLDKLTSVLREYEALAESVSEYLGM